MAILGCSVLFVAEIFPRRPALFVVCGDFLLRSFALFVVWSLIVSRSALFVVEMLA
jgi:hypothetical protein